MSPPKFLMYPRKKNSKKKKKLKWKIKELKVRKTDKVISNKSSQMLNEWLFKTISYGNKLNGQVSACIWRVLYCDKLIYIYFFLRQVINWYISDKNKALKSCQYLRWTNRHRRIYSLLYSAVKVLHESCPLFHHYTLRWTN